MNRFEAARRMNTSIIGPTVTQSEVRDFVLKARVYPLAGLAVEAQWLAFTREMLRGTSIHTVGVANYPLGGATMEFALEMTAWCYDNGADEMDVNVPIGLLRSGREEEVAWFLRELVRIADGRIVKGVIWSDEMPDEEIIATCRLMARCQVPIVKTNPGFGHLTSFHVVPLIKEDLGDDLQVMVAGGVRTTPQMLELFDLGADIVTTSTLDSVLADLPEGSPHTVA
jgi:deoxyribose-phosphate aldolase